MDKIIIKNIKCLVSGDIDNPLIDADTIYIEDKYFKEIGKFDQMNFGKNKIRIIDVQGMTVIPGLIDPHVHPVIGDWHPRQNVIGWMENAFQAGVTTMISQGCCHLPGRPRDASGTKALAILAKKVYDNFHPGGGLKVFGGSVILEPGLTKEDFREMAENGVNLVAEIGGGSTIYKPKDVIKMIKWAKEYDFKVCVHTGPESIPGSGDMTLDLIKKINPNVAVHVNGGCTAPSLEDAKYLAKKTNIALEIIYNGNPYLMFKILNWMKEANRLKDLIIGTDSPIGAGTSTRGIIRTIVQIASLGGISPGQAIAMATGNTARVYDLSTGIIGKDKIADLLVIDSPTNGRFFKGYSNNALDSIKYGDDPAITLIITDGKIRSLRARNTPLSKKHVLINGKEPDLGSLEEYYYGKVI
jgi:enamidase